MLESSVGARICLALATLDNFTYPNDIFPTDRLHSEELTAEKTELCCPGYMMAPDEPETPFEPLVDRLQARTVAQAHIER